MAANQIVAVNVPAGTGAGAAADISGIDVKKTILVTGAKVGELGFFEISGDGAHWKQIGPQFVGPSPSGGAAIKFDVPVGRLRYNRLAAGATAPVIEVSGPPASAAYSEVLPAVPGGVGSGAGSVSTGLQTPLAMIVSGASVGEDLTIDGSDDGGTTWFALAEIIGSQNGGDEPKIVEVYAGEMRVTRKTIGATAPVVALVALAQV